MAAPAGWNKLKHLQGYAAYKISSSLIAEHHPGSTRLGQGGGFLPAGLSFTPGQLRLPGDHSFAALYKALA